ncbi:unnamed protein product [Phytophthora lilii]|uniref:Unnamed protein product n=1 Tax=Phytophthora lilii TaxID=2077276 RepID=A0A9W6X3S8_9STRA|nr:unnamed protein product [Phytophthora lilii]
MQSSTSDGSAIGANLALQFAFARGNFALHVWHNRSLALDATEVEVADVFVLRSSTSDLPQVRTCAHTNPSDLGAASSQRSVQFGFCLHRRISLRSTKPPATVDPARKSRLALAASHTMSDKEPERTMQYQDELPPLPLPPLEQTLEQYVQSCEPLLEPSELEHTKAVCHDFLNGVGPQLQAILQERADTERNWIEEWWETFAYLQPRYPSAININWYGVLPGNWGPRDMSQCEAASIFTHAILKFRKNLLECAREHILSLDDINKQSFDLIERALFCVALDESSASTYDEIARNCLLGDGRNRWYDKPFTLIIHENARGGLNGQHAWADALVVVRLFDYCIRYVNENFKAKFANRAELKPTLNIKPKRLDWVLDNAAYTAIECASAAVGKLIHNSDIATMQFNHYGTAFLKRYKLTPDFFMQMAIQLAHYKMHKKVPAVYETAHTRMFYHGRTETIRSLSKESLAFVKTMESNASDGTKWDALRTALDAHKETLKKCLTGDGIDRHLMGLQIVAEMSGITPKPSLFTDRAFELSKKYLVSTSNISGGPGASPIWGGFSAMYNEGYGVCYALQPDRINVSITCYHVCPETSAATFKRYLETALLEMVDLCLTRNVIYIGSSKI